MKYKTLVLIIIIVLSFPYQAIAESGTLSVSAGTGNSYTQAASGASGNINRDWSKLRFDVTDYNSITQITFSGGQLTCSCNAASSQFTITSGGTGTGTWSYSKADAKVFYYFFNTVITSSSVTLSFDDLSQVTQVTVREYTGADGDSSLVPSLTKPVIIDTHVLSDGVSGSYITQTQTIVTNNYNVTYPGGGIVNVSIDKSGATVSTKIDIRNQTASKLLEPTFNTNSFSYSYLYDAGLILNMSTAAGLYDLVIVNTTGSTIVTTTPTPTPPPIPSGSNTAISFDKSVYNVGDHGIITTNSSGLSSFLGIYTFRVDFYSTKNPLINQFQIDLSKISQQFFVSFDSADTYTANIVKHNVLFGTDTIVSNASAQAQQPFSYIFAPATVNTGTNINISYLFNPVPTSGAIEDVITDQFGFNGIGTYINTTLCPCSSNLTSINYTINGVGKHTLRLWDTQHIKVVASTIIQVNNVGDIVPGNIVDNLLQLDNTQYSINDVINAQYQISSFNWTNFSYFKGILVSSGGVGMGFVSLTSQTGTFQIPVSGGAFNIIQSGSAFVNVTGGDSVFDPGAVVLMSVPVTILSNKDGYGIVVQPTTICLTQTVVAKYTAPFPSVSSAILQIEYMTPAGTTQFSNTSFTSNGTQNIVFNNGKVKDQSGILFNILDSSGNFQVNSIIKYQSTGCIVPGGTATPTPTATETGEQKSNDLVGLLQSNIFWALMFIAGLMVVVASKERKGQ